MELRRKRQKLAAELLKLREHLFNPDRILPVQDIIFTISVVRSRATVSSLTTKIRLCRFRSKPEEFSRALKTSTSFIRVIRSALSTDKSKRQSLKCRTFLKPLTLSVTEKSRKLPACTWRSCLMLLTSVRSLLTRKISLETIQTIRVRLM